jgi:hypothetical protein
MAETESGTAVEFEKALQVGRPPNVVKCFPNSRALIVSGKFIDRAMLGKGGAIAMAANGRNSFVIRGALKAAQGQCLLRRQLLEHGPDRRCDV